jgi:hypothetical protein
MQPLAQLPKNAAGCTLVDFGFGEFGSNAASERAADGRK